MASFWTNRAAYRAQRGELDLLGAGVKFMLVKSTLTPLRTHNTVSEIAAHECDASGYTGGFNGAGRKAIASPTVTEDDVNSRSTFNADDPTAWTLGSGNTLRYAVLIKENASDADSEVWAYHDMGSDKTTGVNPFAVVLSASGIGRIQTN